MATKKQQRVERVLETAARELGTMANSIKAQDAAKAATRTRKEQGTEEKLREMGLAPHVAGAVGCSVVCPDCGQLVPSDFDSFISQEAADSYAREHCDCHKIAADLLPADQLTAILLSPGADDRTRVPLPPGPPKIGACRYCGQSQSVFGCSTEAEAEEYATRRCRCPSAITYQDRLKAQCRREDALREAGENIEDLFGPGASARGDESVGEDALAMLKSGAQLVYDQKIVNQQLSLTGTIKAKIARNSKGVLSIERKDTTTSKMEV